MKLLKCLLVCAWLGIVLCGCGKADNAPKIDAAPFNAAVEEYCRTKNYGMAISELVALTPNGDSAIMTCKMKEAEGLYGIAVVWEFTLIRENERWTVTGHVKK